MGRYDPRRLAPVAELVDAADSKSVGGDIVLVRVRPGAPLRAHRLQKYSPHAARLFCSRPRPTIRRRRQAHIPRRSVSSSNKMPAQPFTPSNGPIPVERADSMSVIRHGEPHKRTTITVGRGSAGYWSRVEA